MQCLGKYLFPSTFFKLRRFLAVLYLNLKQNNWLDVSVSSAGSCRWPRNQSTLHQTVTSKSGKVQLAEFTKKHVSHPRAGLWEMRIRSDPSSKSSCGTIHSEGHNWTGSTSANPKLFYTPVMFINTIQFPLRTRSDLAARPITQSSTYERDWQI